MKRKNAYFIVIILVCLGHCSEKKGLPVGSPCIQDNECNEGVCASQALGFNNGYCTGPCEFRDSKPADLAGREAICAWSMGEARWISTCRDDTRNETGYECTDSHLYAGNLLIPVCRQDDDCRGCVCATDSECSPAHDWKCVQSVGIGEPCTLGSDICEFSCVISSEGSGVCSDGNPPALCFRRADCLENDSCTAENALEERCDSNGIPLDLFDVCYMVPVQPLTEGQCIKWLGSICETNEECAMGSCCTVGTTTSSKRCTAFCDAWGDGAAMCESYFEDERATCCYNVGGTGIDYCMYEGPGSGCQWSP